MSSEPQEMEDISRISSALLINIGTLRSEGKASMAAAGMRTVLSPPEFVLIV